MRIGDTFEAAIWLDGKESDVVRRQYEADMNEALDVECRRNGYGHGPVRFYEIRPGHVRVPPVPPHVDGPNVRMLVCEAVITPGLRPVSFLGDLDIVDLERLRAITRRVAGQRAGKPVYLSDEDCDAIIEEIGPDAALDAVRKAVNSGAVH